MSIDFRNYDRKASKGYSCGYKLFQSALGEQAVNVEDETHKTSHDSDRSEMKQVTAELGS